MSILCEVKTLMLQSELSSYKKALEIMNFQSKDSLKSLIQIQPYSTKYLKRIYFPYIDHSTTFCYQSLMANLLLALIFTITKQSRLHLLKYLNHHAELIPTYKMQ